MVVIDAVKEGHALVHYQVGRYDYPDEWVALDDEPCRLEPLSSIEIATRQAEEVRAAKESGDAPEDDDTACELCGSAGDSATLLLCDSEGCGAAFHTGCLAVPLHDDKIPEGDWFCERCAEQEAVGGALADAKALLTPPSGGMTAARWRQRLLRARSSATVATLLTALERALFPGCLGLEPLSAKSIYCRRLRGARAPDPARPSVCVYPTPPPPARHGC